MIKILIVKLSSLGDVLQTLPALAFLKKVLPSVQIDWLVEKQNSELLQQHPYLEKVYLFEKEYFRNPKDLWNFAKNLREVLYTAVIDFQGLLKSAFLTFLAKGEYKIGFSKAREGSSFFYNYKVRSYDPEKPSLLRYLFLAEASVKLLSSCSSLTISEALSFKEEIFYSIPLPEKAPPIEIKSPFILLIPEARWKTKLWPLNYWREFLRLTKDLRKKYAFYLIGGGGEEEIKIWAEEREREFSNLFSWIGKLSLREVVYLMKRAEIVVTVDTGPMHLASLLNRPILALFGPTSPQRTGPWSEYSYVLQSQLPCVPCFKRSCKELTCMQELFPQRVDKKLREILESIRHPGGVALPF